MSIFDLQLTFFSLLRRSHPFHLGPRAPLDAGATGRGQRTAHYRRSRRRSERQAAARSARVHTYDSTLLDGHADW